MTPEMEFALKAAQLSSDAIKAIGMGLAAGLGVVGPGIGIGILVSKSIRGNWTKSRSSRKNSGNNVYWYCIR